MLLVRGVDDDDGHAYAYDDRAVVLLAAAAAHKPALWEVTAAAAVNSSRADREWSADEEAEPSQEKPKTRQEDEEDEEYVGVDRRHPAEGSLKVVTFVNDTLQWNVVEEEAVYALHGYQIEEIEELRGRYYAPDQDEDGYIGIGRGGGRQRAQPAKKKARPSLYVPHDEQLQALGEFRSTRRAEYSGSSRKGYL
jgi:hypothetical protein